MTDEYGPDHPDVIDAMAKLAGDILCINEIEHPPSWVKGHPDAPKTPEEVEQEKKAQESKERYYAEMRAAGFDEPLYYEEYRKALRQEKARRRARQELDAEETAAAKASAEKEQERLAAGGDFIYDEPEKIPAVWGDGDQVLWAEGEGLMIAAHQGLGKTTLGQQLILHRVGIRKGDLLGLSVAPTDGRVLYLAMDRPRQAARSLRRMVTDNQRNPLDEKLVVWRGPLPINPLSSPQALADWIDLVGKAIWEITTDEETGEAKRSLWLSKCDTLVVDSVKDLAPGVAQDEVGAALNSAWQEVIARGWQLLLLHHERKAGQGEKRHHKLDDVYGSTWLTSGLGSVIALDGEPGDATVELKHLKQPAEPVGPWTIRHDHATGTTTALEGPRDLWARLRELRGQTPATADQLAEWVYGRSAEGDVKKVRRRLAAWEKKALVRREPGRQTPQGRIPDAWFVSPVGLLTEGPDEGEG